MPRLPAPEFGHYDMLTPERRRFVDEYLVDLNGRAAALRAGYKHPQDGARLLNISDVQDAIRECQEKAANARHISGGEFILSKLWDITTADPRELCELHHVPCRYCWGINGQYQFTKTEMDRALRAHEYGRSKQPLEAIWPRDEAEYAYYTAGSTDLPFDPQGGDGYTENRDPNPQCSECHGNGILKPWFADTRKLSPQARQLYRGTKVTSKGTEMVLANQDIARDILARHYTIGVERKAILVQHIDPRELSDDELIRAIADAETTLLEIENGNNAHEIQVNEAQRAATNRHTRQIAMAKARAARNGRPMITRPRG